ncbi:Abi family protein [Vibrio sp. SCSIO 43136]|uniref:Abi family protein n=1 Tax=Vibrio sp. SCSIO 43136 TaxID=2819101 RepID=UPI002075DFE2|nr:Abi family protein [Vibrio sp. SCSIO 43136]USD65926.1 Abi family protein [Vibrio sp. SCSIO 43136]
MTKAISYRAIERTLSTARLSTYRQEVKKRTGQNNLQKAIQLYEWNAELSASLLVVIHIYEVTLRNAISAALELRYGVDWPINVAFQNSLPKWQKQELITLDEVVNYTNVGKVIPELRPVWFENILRPANNIRIWKPFLKQVFPNSGDEAAELVIKRLKSGCFRIRKLRNRVAHHEPIFAHPTVIEVYPIIAEAIEWRCLDTREWLDSVERLTPLLRGFEDIIRG